jgi:O-antigen/teichoic acid export membrane protein
MQLSKLIANLKEDPLLDKVIRNSVHLFSNNSLSLILSFLMGILSARLLGAAGFGLVGLVMSYASTVNSLLSFRMSELVVRYGGEFIERNEKGKASALIKAAGMTEGFVSLLAFLLVLLTSGLASQYISKTPNTAWMFSFFAAGLLANFNYETSIGVLQITDRIKFQGTIHLIQSIVGVLVIATASLWNGGTTIVLLAYLLGKVILGLGVFIAAQVQLRRILGTGWWQVSFSTISPYRELVRFAISSNISATIIKIFRESEILWVGYFLSTTAAGYYRVAYMLVSLLSVVIDPLIATVYPELNRLIVQKAWPSLRRFLRKVTTLAFAMNITAGLGFILFGRLALTIFGGGEEFAVAFPALLALFVGLAFNYTLFWNRPLLLSIGLPEIPIWVTLIVGLVKVALAFWLIPRFGILAAGALLSYYYIASVGIMALRGLKEIDLQSKNTLSGGQLA